MSNKPLNISEEARVQMPMKTVASLIAMVAIGTWAYFGIIETQNKLSTQVELMQKDLIPLCGMDEGLAAIVAASTQETDLDISKNPVILPNNNKNSRLLDEAYSKSLLSEASCIWLSSSETLSFHPPSKKSQALFTCSRY